MSAKNASEVVGLFLQNRPNGGCLTAKQTAWAFGVATDSEFFVKHGTECLRGHTDMGNVNVYWEVLKYKNGASLLKVLDRFAR